MKYKIYWFFCFIIKGGFNFMKKIKKKKQLGYLSLPHPNRLIAFKTSEKAYWKLKEFCRTEDISMGDCMRTLLQEWLDGNIKWNGKRI